MLGRDPDASQPIYRLNFALRKVAVTFNGNNYQECADASGLSLRYVKRQIKKNEDLKDAIRNIHEGIDYPILVAKKHEVLSFWTSVMRGELIEETHIVGLEKDGSPKTKIVKRMPTTAERLKASEYLGRYHSAFNDKLNVNNQKPTTIQVITGVPKPDVSEAQIVEDVPDPPVSDEDLF